LTIPAHEKAVAVLTMTRPDGTVTNPCLPRRRPSGPRPVPPGRAASRRDAGEHPTSAVTMRINERAWDAATVTEIHAAGFPDDDLLDAEQTRQALEDVDNQS
jgi:hypothetical protein